MNQHLEIAVKNLNIFNQLSITIMRCCVTCFIFLFFIHLSATAQKQQYKIVYNVLEDKAKDNYEIYSMNMDGSDKKNITNTAGVEWVYYAFKDKVYYISDIDTCHRCYFLYEMDANGNRKRKVSNLQLEDSWMGSRNNGTEMIVLGRIGKQVRSQLFLVDINTGNYNQISYDTSSTKRDPIFLPGGKDIVLAYRPDKTLRKTIPDELWKMQLNGDNKKQLTYYPKTDTSAKWFDYHAGPPQYNNKHKFISYLSKQKKQNQIFAITIDGKKRWQITNGEMNSGWHSWSSDGKWLAMDKSTPDEKNYDIYLMNYKKRKTIQLTTDEKYEQAPVIVEIK